MLDLGGWRASNQNKYNYITWKYCQSPERRGKEEMVLMLWDWRSLIVLFTILKYVFFEFIFGDGIILIKGIWFISCMQTRKRVLINAFTVRALRDTFSPARGAGRTSIFFSSLVCFWKSWQVNCFPYSVSWSFDKAPWLPSFQLLFSTFFASLQFTNVDILLVTGVMALCATSSYYDVTEIATRILPNIVVLTIDPDRY